MGDRIGRATMQTRYLVTVDEIGMSGVEYMYTRDKIGCSLVVGSMERRRKLMITELKRFSSSGYRLKAD